MLRYVRGCFDPGSKVTVGAAYLGHRATLADGRQCKLEVWDTAGQERYSSLAPLYYRGAAAAAVVFDAGDRESFAKARHWVGELQRNAGPGIGELRVGRFAFSSFEWSEQRSEEAFLCCVFVPLLGSQVSNFFPPFFPSLFILPEINRNWSYQSSSWSATRSTSRRSRASSRRPRRRSLRSGKIKYFFLFFSFRERDLFFLLIIFSKKEKLETSKKTETA